MGSKKVFLPLTLDNSTKTAFSGKQLIGFFLFGVVYVFFQVVVIRMQSSLLYTSPLKVPITLVVEVIGTYFIVFLLRKIVIREDKIMKNYQANQSLQKTELDFMWDIFSIKDGRIRYCSSGREAMVIRLTHGYLLDRPYNQEQMHRDAINTALGNLSKQGYTHIYFNREVRDPNLGPLQETQRLITKYKDERIYATANQILQHTFHICETVANTEQEYYVIFADTMDTIKKLDHVAKEFINSLQGAVYVRKDILNDDQIWEFICSLYGLKFIDKSRLLNKMFSDNDLQLVEILEVNRASDYARRQQPVTVQQSNTMQAVTMDSHSVGGQVNIDSEDDFL